MYFLLIFITFQTSLLVLCHFQSFLMKPLFSCSVKVRGHPLGTGLSVGQARITADIQSFKTCKVCMNLIII